MICNSEESGELVFEMLKCLQAWRVGVQMIQRPFQQIIQFWLGMFRFHRHLQQLAAIGCQQGGCVIAAQTLTPLADGNLAQRVQFSMSRTAQRNFSAEKQIELPCKLAFRSSGTLRHRFDQSLRLGQPVNDQAGFRQAGESDHDGFRRGHAAEIWRLFHFFDNSFSRLGLSRSR